MAWSGGWVVVPPGTVGPAGAATHIALGSGGCSSCHATNIAVGGFKIGTAPQLAAAGHAAGSAPSGASCHGTGAARDGGPGLAAQLAAPKPPPGAARPSCPRPDLPRRR